MTDKKEATLYEKLEKEIVMATWGLLKEHHEKGTLVRVDPDLDLAQVGADIAQDNVVKIRELMTNLKLGQPTLEQVQAWEEDEDVQFSMIIVQPYVLVQERVEQ